MTILRRDELVENDGVLHRLDASRISEYRRRWEGEAVDDHIRSAIAGGSSGPVDPAALTAKTSPLWDRFPGGRHFETVLEIGARYGRIPLYLSNSRSATWSTYCAVDISEKCCASWLGTTSGSAGTRRPTLLGLRVGGLSAARGQLRRLRDLGCALPAHG